MISKNRICRPTLKALAVAVLLTYFPASAPAQPTDGSNLTISTHPEVTLVDLRDMGLILVQIKQQAVNIYMEATRKPVNISAQPKIEDLKIITKAPVDEKGKYLKTRPEWLTYYVGTMEPLIHLFKVNVQKDGHDIDYILVPSGTEKKFQALLKDYDQGVKDMDAAVSEVFENISEKNNNIKVAKAAVNLYKVADHMESKRQEAFNILKNIKGKKPFVKVKMDKLPQAQKD